MMRWIAILGCGLALASALPLGSTTAKSDGVYQPVRAAVAPVFTRKLCTPPSRWGRTPATWVCNASEKCCYDWVFRRGTCVSASNRCI